MNRIFKWLESKLSLRWAAERHSPVGVISGEYVEEENIDNDETAVLPTLPNVEDSSFTVIESTGPDPYSSGSFGTPKSRSHT